jgi:hypothetical protein
MPTCNRCSYDLEGAPLKGGAVTCPECGLTTPVFANPPPPPVRPTFENRTLHKAHCRACGYLLEGLAPEAGEVICPECGLVRDPREADGPGVMPRFARALALMITPAAALWTLWYIAGNRLHAPAAATLSILGVSIAWALGAPYIIPMIRARRYGARPRIVVDEVAASYGVMLLAAGVLSLLLTASGL